MLYVFVGVSFTKSGTAIPSLYFSIVDTTFSKTSVKNSRKQRKKLIIDGYSDFLLVDKNGSPKVALHIENEFRWAMMKYNKHFPKRPLSNITPHVFRHTFCTNMVNAGMDVKVLQYIMGHSEIDVTLNIYTHMSYDRAASQMLRLVDGTPEGPKVSFVGA